MARKATSEKDNMVKDMRGRAGLFCKGRLDLTFLFLVLGILSTGLVMMFSASSPYALTYYGDSFYFIKRQAVFAVVGVILMLFISRINYHVYKNFAWIIYGISIAMLFAVLILPEVVPGFKRWLAIGPLTFQPSEVAKFAVILLLSTQISKNYSRMKEFKFSMFLLIMIGVVALFIVAEKHLSATILVLLIGMIIVFAGGMKFRYIMLAGGVGALGAVIAIAAGLIDYGGDRLKYWLDPWGDPLGKGFQTIQSLLAIGSGGITGQGIGQSTQKYWVPEPQNDFIFSIVCEELGLFGALLIVVAFALLVWRGLVISMKAPDKFGAFLTLGIVFQIGLQTAFNMLVVTNSIPNTGISLPFFSYGGSSLIMLLCQMGMVLGVSRQARIEKS